LGESFLYRMVRYIVSSILLVKIFGWLVWFYRRPSLALLSWSH
jgi:tRNA U38,U39,U40 pseudouridine synthase TruA